jgi:methylated-DNA-[protein]-cysteine S-methyltransferase
MTKKQIKKLYLHSFRTKIGVVRTASTDKGVAIIALPGENSEYYFEGKIERHFADYQIDHGGPMNKKAEVQVKGYLENKRASFSLPLDIQGPAFCKKVLKRVARIPRGKTMSYGEIAAAVGNPRAARAVGSANANNTLPLVIPCHRVVAQNGLGGYGGGEHIKRRLLKMEGVEFE